MGFNTTAKGVGGVALGAWSQAFGTTSFAMGNGPLAEGDHSVAFGFYTQAIGYAAMTTGEHTKAYGSHSTAIGDETRAKGTNSFSMGYSTNAKGYSSLVIGMYNDSLLTTNQTVAADTTPLFIVGNGSSNVVRHNAVVVYKNGTTKVNGVAEVNGVADINGNADISGFTNLGTAAPKIKMKKLTGTSAAAQNAWVNVAHGLTLAKIISVNIIMTIPGFVNLPPSYTFQSGYQYDYQVAAANIVVINSVTNSANILSKAFTILIVYEE